MNWLDRVMLIPIVVFVLACVWFSSAVCWEHPILIIPLTLILWASASHVYFETKE
jgi:hypothetical protein